MQAKRSRLRRNSARKRVSDMRRTELTTAIRLKSEYPCCAESDAAIIEDCAAQFPNKKHAEDRRITFAKAAAGRPQGW